MRLWLTRNPQGWYTISFLPLIKVRISGTRRSSLYLQPGEPMDLEYICPQAVKVLFGVALEPWQSVRVEVETRVTGEVMTVDSSTPRRSPGLTRRTNIEIGDDGSVRSRRETRVR